MDKEFVLYEQALALKELGFNEPCYAWHVSKTYGLEFGLVHVEELIKDAILAPTYSQAFRWFREKYGLCHNIGCFGTVKENKFHWNLLGNKPGASYEDVTSYEEAELACLKKLIEITKTK